MESRRRHSQAAPAPVLTTKLRPPDVESGFVRRERLEKKVDLAGGQTLTLITAPAGWGKTTLMRQWYYRLRKADVTVGWVSLDALDNDPARFVNHLFAALGLGVEQRAASGLPDSSISVSSAIARMINALSDTDGRFALMLDDFHLLHENAVVEAVELLVDRAPSNLRVFLASRGESNLRLSRWQAGNRMRAIVADDLKFEPCEAADFLARRSPLAFSKDQVRRLTERTEGWITGLQLAALSLQEQADTETFLDSFSGRHCNIYDYLSEEVLARQTDDVREFLLQTSILDRLTADLCDAMTGRDDGQSMLELLERRNIFVFRLGAERVWYRYHHLFAEFLRNRLRRERPRALPGFHERAGEWLASKGFASEAVTHLITASAFERAADVLETAAHEFIRHGEFEHLRLWLEKLPDNVVRTRPQLGKAYAWVLIFVGAYDRARERLGDAMIELEQRRASDRIDNDAAERLAAEIHAIRANLDINRAHDPDQADYGPAVRAALSPDDGALRSSLYLAEGYGLRIHGELDLALVAFQEALAVAELCDADLVATNARSQIGMVQLLLGKTGEAGRIYREALVRAELQDDLEAFSTVCLRVDFAELLYETGQLDAAEGELTAALPLLKRINIAHYSWGLVKMARIAMARSDAEAALGHLSCAREIARSHNVLRVRFHADLYAVRFALLRGDNENAARLGRRVLEPWIGLKVSDVGPLHERHELALLLDLRIRLAVESSDDLAAKVAGVRNAVMASGRAGSNVAILVLEALALDASGRSQDAHLVMAQAVRSARKIGFARTIPDEGSAALALAARAGEREDISDTAPCPRDPHWPERLHVREQQILELVATGMRNREVAQRLKLSEETVKWYLKSLYGKLDVRSRTQAVAQARELRLIQ